MARFFLFIPIYLTFALCIPYLAMGDTPPTSLSRALQIWKDTNPSSSQKNLFDTMHFASVSGDNAPLARYRPENGGGQIEIGQNLRQYRRDYVILSSNQDMAFKPDFDQYMTILTTLSLANESAHYTQDKNGSLNDFYIFYQHGQTQEACALYGLQQYASDIVMMEFAIRLERLLLSSGSVKGLNALRIALEKNDLRDEFEEFRESLKSQDSSRINKILHAIRKKRNNANMSGLDFCNRSGGDALLDQSIINRATEPVITALKYYQAKQNNTKEAPIRNYNN